MQCHHIATRDTPSTQMSAVLSCGNVDFGVATPLQQYKETYRIVHTCDITPQNIMAEKINIKLLIEEITKSHQRCCNVKILRCHAFRQDDATITSMQCRLQDVWRQTLIYIATFKIHARRNACLTNCAIEIYPVIFALLAYHSQRKRFVLRLRDASTKSRKFDKGHGINSKNIKKR
ncbi:hypothetical protein HZH68_002673 [Vespula germanica]|uniref:Uncharacterized protein n=1 Tax=Vespula germanica TaxID=30212 RepID=A0A834NMQ7_VESGE|nr:hypothetical protein HZH68_002673 [Vespula germanica]